MATFIALEKIALSLPEVTVAPHFEKISFRVRKKIFLTYNPQAHQATLKLSLDDQANLSESYENVFSPVPNKWGLQGWTFMLLENVEERVLEEAVMSAYCATAPAKLAQRAKEDGSDQLC